MATLGRLSYEVIALPSAVYGILQLDAVTGKNRLVLTVHGSEGLAIDFANRLTQTEPDYTP